MLLNTAKRAVPRGRRNHYTPCWDDQCQNLLEKYQKAVISDHPTIANSLCSYISEKRRKRREDSVEQIDFTHSSREAWSVLNRLTGKAKQFRPVPVTTNAIASRLVENGRHKKPDRQYSISVHKVVHQLTTNTHSDVNLCEEVSNTGMTQAIHNMKCGKAPGPDNIHPEFIKNLGPSGLKWLAALFSTCMRLNLLPKIWRKANIITILKPGRDAKVPKSYRPISLLYVPFKILERLILSRITLNVEKCLQDFQAGFHAERSTHRPSTATVFDHRGRPPT